MSILPALSLGLQGLGSLGSMFGGNKTKYGWSPEQQALWERIWGQAFGQGIPSWLSSPIIRQGQQEQTGIRNWFGSNLPQGSASGLELANLMKVGANTQQQLGESAGRYKSGLLSMLQGLLPQAQNQPNSMSKTSGGMSGMGDMLDEMYWEQMLKQLMSGGGGAAGVSGIPQSQNPFGSLLF